MDELFFAYLEDVDLGLRMATMGLEGRYLPQALPLIAPYVNSYKRFLPGTFAPTKIAWSIDNRTAGYRLVGEGTIAAPYQGLQQGVLRIARLDHHPPRPVATTGTPLTAASATLACRQSSSSSRPVRTSCR